MALVNNTLPGLFGGVSQQTPALRHETQVSEMINCYPSIVGGLMKRPPLTNIYSNFSIPTNCFIYSYDRGSGSEQYMVVINPDGFYRVFDIINKIWATSWAYSDYLTVPNGTDVSTAFSITTVGDTTFIVNKTKECKMDSTLDYNDDPEWESTFFYWVSRTNGDESDNASLRYTYYLYKDDEKLLYNHDTDSYGVTSSNSEEAVRLMSEGTVKTTLTKNIFGYTVVTTIALEGVGGEYKGSVLRKRITDGSKWSGADSWGSQASTAWQGKVKKLQDLPNELMFENSVIQITGDDDTAFDNYYVKYVDGVYKETFRPGIKTSFDATTMPHKLSIRRVYDEATSSYVYISGYSETGIKEYNYFTPIEWDTRKVGDDDSASEPSFIGQSISDVFFYRNRLGFVAGDNVILSEVGSYYNFWPTTVTTTIDSDMIDVAVDSNKAITLLYATPFNKELLLFGDKGQFVMSSGDTLTPKDVSVQQSTAFTIKDTRPVTSGPNAYFVTEKNNWSGVREYYVQPDSLSNDAADVTAHCPNYIPKNVTKITGSSQNDMVFVLSEDTPNTIYCYNFYWNGEEKAQSAWHKWVLYEDLEDVRILNIDVLESKLLVTIFKDNYVSLESIELGVETNITSVEYKDTNTHNYTSKVLLTTPGFPTGSTKVDDIRGKFIINNIKFNADYGSFYNVISHRIKDYNPYTVSSGVGSLSKAEYITSKEFNYKVYIGILPNTNLLPSTSLYPGGYTYTQTTDNKYSIHGNRDNLEIEINNSIDRGFKINSVDIQGNLLKNPKNI